ncbi:MAG TPA: LysM peptidoglycan-binding domain-containing protein [Firmicutes bacterium]|nr:LysM peptidoglycan-binding domain-containing protein [Bacillota bacterium]
MAEATAENVGTVPSWWNEDPRQREPRRPSTPCPGLSHVVRTSDSMWKIARRYGVSLRDLIDANPHIPDPEVLIPGDVLCIPGRRPEEPERPPEEMEEWCCVILEPVHREVEDPSVTLVRLGRRGHVMIALHDMPDPARLVRESHPDSEFWRLRRAAYVGWLMSREGRLKRRIFLLSAGEGFWIGHQDADVETEDEVIVTAEESAQVREPGDVLVYRARLEECTRREDE